MARHLRGYGSDVFPATGPKVGGDFLLLIDGTVVQAVPDGGTGIAWAVIKGGSVLGSVKGALQAATPAATLSGDGMTLTASANASFNATSPGGFNTWAVGDRVLVAGQLDPKENGVYVVFALGSAVAPVAPWILTRANDARTAQALPVGREFQVEDGFAQARTFRLVNAGNSAPVPGVDDLSFAPTEFFVGGAGSALAGSLLNLAVNAPGGVAGAVDVVVFNGNCPFPMTVKGLSATIGTAGAAASSAQLRTALAGGGSVASGPVLTDAQGRALEGAGGGYTAEVKLGVGDTLVVRLSDGLAAGTFNVAAQVN